MKQKTNENSQPQTPQMNFSLTTNPFNHPHGPSLGRAQLQMLKILGPTQLQTMEVDSSRIIQTSYQHAASRQTSPPIE
eukprot:764138-Hanusia_phi.AAC.8